ncbi:hypothetical protein ABZ896_17155 [Streptomyces sp. NPDC047072]|uniref:hypothetical protein n=1 Tax=Streptomyces sp. NPDC047072 TaxID=3154809 RepID=UPI0033F5281B
MMRQDALEKAVAELDQLSRDEYDSGLFDLLTDRHRPELERNWRLGRLLGVAVKKPFAAKSPLDPGLSRTQARRAWELLPETFDDGESQATWQFQVLATLASDVEVAELSGLYPPEEGIPITELVRAAATKMQQERGFFRCMALSAHKYLCGDPAVRANVDESVRASGVQNLPLDSKSLVGVGAASAADVISTNVPMLGVSGELLIVGFLIIIGNIGLDGFCSWVSEDVIRRDQPSAES